MSQCVLIVAAHPDDEVLGCGGTAARLARAGADVYSLILGEGATSRQGAGGTVSATAEVARLGEQAAVAGRALGVREVFRREFPDNRFDSLPRLDLVRAVEEIIRRVRPQIVFTHCGSDLNVDHWLTHEAVLTATRPLPGETVREIYAFEILSSTEWRFPSGFQPDCFFDIAETLEAKLEAMRAYTGELREPPHPRSLDGIRRAAEVWGMRVGLTHAEAFQTIRVVR